MSNGILFVAFGQKFYDMAMKTVAYSRRFTELPFMILTNINNGSLKIKDTDIKYINMPTDRNRQIKTTMIKYSPFDKTVYIDADSVIQKNGIEEAFNLIDGHDVMLNNYGTWHSLKEAHRFTYYIKTMRRLNVDFPINIFYGAFIGFNKTETSNKFFVNWNKNWIDSHIAREMPALACTVKKMPELKVKRIGNANMIFTWKMNKTACVQHEYGAGFWRTFFPAGTK